MSIITFNRSDSVEVFIDRENVEKVSGHGSVDYVTLVQCVAQGRPICNVTVFDMIRENDTIQRKVHDTLRSAKIRLNTPIGHCGNSSKQMGVDVALACEVVSQAATSQCNTIIIVSGDGDFIPVIKKVKERGKKIEFASWEECANKSLMDECDYFTALDSLPILYPEAVE